MPIPPTPPRRGVPSAGAPASPLHMLQGALLIIGVLYFGSDLLIPVALSVLLAFVLAPVMRALRRTGLPRIASVLLAVGLALVLVAGAAVLIGRQASSLAENLPGYQAAITHKLSGLQTSGGLVDRVTSTLNNVGRSFQKEMRRGEAANQAEAPAATPSTEPPAEPAPVPVVLHEPEPTALQTLQRVAEPLLHPLATGGVVLILVIFILLYREDLRDRLIRLAGASDLHRTMAALDDAAYRLSRFFLAQVGMNTGFGLVITGMLWLIGIPNPVLWGAFAGLMRFVPFIGSYIASALPLLLAIAVDPGWTTFGLVLALFVCGELLMGQVLEPLVFGHSTGLSPIAVIAAATFWTWLWGAIGLLLAVPLTVCLVVLGRHVDALEFLEVMLGDQPALDPDETFYQRALAGDLDALADQSERALKDAPAEAFLDTVALPGLYLAQADAIHHTLAPERLERLRESVLTLLEDLDPGEPEEEAAATLAAPEAWRSPGAVLCLGGRGPFDGLLAAMLAEVLSWRGFGVQQASAGGALPGTPPRLACLCLMEGGSSAAAARYVMRRTRRRLPAVTTLGLVWQNESAPENRLAEALRSEGGATPLTLASALREAVELVMEAAAADAGQDAAAAPGGAAVPAAITPAPVARDTQGGFREAGAAAPA